MLARETFMNKLFSLTLLLSFQVDNDLAGEDDGGPSKAMQPTSSNTLFKQCRYGRIHYFPVQRLY